jgi:TPR repeat protein
MDKAQRLFTEAIESSNEPDGFYGLANVLLAKTSMEVMRDPDPAARKQAAQEALVSPLVLEAIVHLEEAARGGHVFAMFNLGISHLYGYGQTDGRRDPDLAAEWFEVSGLPEGLFAKSLHASSVGRKKEAEMWRSRASVLGFGSSWRKQARERTGSGGSSGAKLNLKWPPLPTGETPQEF